MARNPIMNALPASGRAKLHRFALGGAWFFIITSLAFVAWVVGVKWSDPSGVTTLYQTTVGEETFRTWALAYHGVPGLIWAVAQMGVVFAAAVASAVAGRPWRAITHGILIAWSAVWMIDLACLAVRGQEIISFAQAGLLIVLCGCTVYRALCRPRSALQAGTPQAAGGSSRLIEAGTADGLTPDRIASSDTVRDITATVKPAGRLPMKVVQHVLALMHGTGRRARPIASALKTRLSGAGRRMRRYFRRHGVVPDPDRTSAPRSMPR